MVEIEAPTRERARIVKARRARAARAKAGPADGWAPNILHESHVVRERPRVEACEQSDFRARSRGTNHSAMVSTARLTNIRHAHYCDCEISGWWWLHYSWGSQLCSPVIPMELFWTWLPIE